MILEALIGFRSRQRENGAQSPLSAARHAVSLCRSLLSETGEVSGVRVATEALEMYKSLEGAALAAFFDSLATEFSPDPDAVGGAADAYRKDPSAGNLSRLLAIVEPARQELFRRLNLAPDGIRVLVEMRRELLRRSSDKPHWAPIEADLSHLLGSWFNRGFLELHRIDWRTPAIVLEKLIRYEAVHQIHGWHDLRRRLEMDRRCYAFFHPALRDDPIIFVEVALTRRISPRVQPLVDPNAPVIDPQSATCAVFYSITNCHEGLRGVPLGNFLIKKVAQDLGNELRQIRTFATASPVPGFRRWLETTIESHRERPQLAALMPVLADMSEPDWAPEKNASELAQRELPSLCAHYFLHANNGSKEPLDSVARFHLRNGARLERINWLGDTSPAGFQRACGLMVNYIYRLSEVERNHESYVKERKVVTSRTIESQAKESILERRERRDRRQQ